MVAFNLIMINFDHIQNSGSLTSFIFFQFLHAKQMHPIENILLHLSRLINVFKIEFCLTHIDCYQANIENVS